MKKLLVSLLGISLLQAAPAVQEITTLKELKAATEAAENKPLVMFFYAPWCGVCKGMKDPYDQLAAELKGKAELVKISVENKTLKPLADSLGITSIPTIYIRKVGRQTKDQLKKAIEAAMG